MGRIGVTDASVFNIPIHIELVMPPPHISVVLALLPTSMFVMAALFPFSNRPINANIDRYGVIVVLTLVASTIIAAGSIIRIAKIIVAATRSEA